MRGLGAMSNILINYKNTQYPANIQIKSLNGSFLMERATRLELAIFSLGRRHSTTELCPHRTSLIYHKILFFSLIFYKFPLLQVNSSTIFLNIYVKILQNFFSFSFFYLFWKLPQEYQFKCLLYSSLWWWKNKKMSR